MALTRVAVAGAGYIGRRHIDVLMGGGTGCALAAVCEPSQQALEKAGVVDAPIYADLADMLAAERPDGVVIATPNQLHVEGALACIDRGIPVLIEKPLADTVASARRLVDAGEAAGVAVLTGHHRRHNPIMEKAAEIVAGGGVGRVVAASAVFLTHKPVGYHDADWRRRPGGGPLMINAIHDVDCLRMLCGDVAAVGAVASNAVRGFEVEDTAAATLAFESGAVGALLCSDTASSPWSWELSSRENPQFPYAGSDCYQVTGTLGALAVPSLRHYRHEEGEQSWNAPLGEQCYAVAPADPFVRQMHNFGAVIRGDAAPTVSGREGLKTLTTVMAIARSVETGATVRLADVT